MGNIAVISLLTIFPLPKEQLVSLQVTAGWWLLSALIGMGSSTVSPHLTEIVELWRAVVVPVDEDKAAKSVRERYCPVGQAPHSFFPSTQNLARPVDAQAVRAARRHHQHAVFRRMSG